MQLLERKEKLEKLNKSYDRLQKKYGAKKLVSIYKVQKIIYSTSKYELQDVLNII